MENRIDRAIALIVNAEVLLQLGERDVTLSRCKACELPLLTFHGQEAHLCGHCGVDNYFSRRAVARRRRAINAANDYVPQGRPLVVP
jgi:hypothetical protein